MNKKPWHGKSTTKALRELDENGTIPIFERESDIQPDDHPLQVMRKLLNSLAKAQTIMNGEGERLKLYLYFKRSAELDFQQETDSEGNAFEIQGFDLSEFTSVSIKVWPHQDSTSDETTQTIVAKDEIFTAKEAADYLGIRLTSLRKRIDRARRKGEAIPFQSVGDVGQGRLIVSKSRLDEWDKQFQRRKP